VLVIVNLAGKVEYVDTTTNTVYPITGDACRIAFAFVALAYPQSAIPDQIAHAIWDGEPPQSWHSSLRNIVARLRKQLPDSGALESTANGYRLAIERLEVEGLSVEGFEVDVVQARRVVLTAADFKERRNALDVLQNIFVPGATTEWVERQSSELSALMLAGLDRLAADFRAQGDGPGAFAVASEAVSLAPLRETSRQELLRAHLLSGARVDGLRAYEVWRKTVGEELGAVPSPETEKLYLQLLGINTSPAEAAPLQDRQAAPGILDLSVEANFEPNAGQDLEHTDTRATAIPEHFQSPLIGRTAEVDQLNLAIDEHRLLCVSGLGGIGKSHLVAHAIASKATATSTATATATATATKAATAFTARALTATETTTTAPTTEKLDTSRNETVMQPALQPVDDRRAVYWISMEAVERSRDPLALLADRLQATSQGGSAATAAIIETLSTGSPIVVLDGATQRGASPIVRFLTDSCPEVTTIITSRQPFEFATVHVVRVGPIGLSPTNPNTDNDTSTNAANDIASDTASDTDDVHTDNESLGLPSDAAQLLWREAIRHGADPVIWHLSACEAVANRLDGVPLGLILAAKRASVMSPEVMSNALDQRGASALDQGPDQSLGFVVGWTVGELSLYARKTLETLAVLPEPLEFDAAMHICTAAVLASEANGSGHEQSTTNVYASALSELLNVGLLRRTSTFGRTRFVVLQIVSAAVRHEQGEQHRAKVLNAHARYFLGAANRTAAGVRSSEESDAVRSAELNVVNFATAIDHLLHQGKLDEALQMADDLVGFAFYRLNQSIASAIIRVASAPGVSTSAGFCEVAAGAALMAWMLGDQASAKKFLGWSNAAESSWVHHQAAGVIALYSGDTKASTNHFEASLAIAETNASLYERAISLSQITLLRTFEGRGDALDSAIASFRCGEESRNATAQANGAWAMGIALLDIDPEGAREHLLASRKIALEVNARLSAGSADAPLAMLEHRFGATFSERRETIERQMKFWLDSSHSAQFWLIAQEAAVLLCERGNHRSSALILGAVGAAPFKVPLPGTERRNVQKAVGVLTKVLGERYATIVQMGSALSAKSCAELIQRELINDFTS
jgi:DNA-binding SARP family transcriptional activator